MRIASIYVVTGVYFIAAAVNLSFVLDKKAYLTAGFLVAYLVLALVTLIILWTTRRTERAKLCLGFCVILLILEQILDGGGVFGLGVLYLAFGFSVAYPLFGIVPTIVFMIVYYSGLLFRLSAGNFLPTSIFNSSEITLRMLIILGMALVLQATTCFAIEVIIRHLSRLAYFDQVTCLPNRFKFLSFLHDGILRNRKEPRPLSVVAVKTVNMNKLNTMLGNALADDLLRNVGSRISGYRNATRAVGRWSSSIFVLYTDLHELSHLERYTAELMATLSEPYLVDGRVVSVFFNSAVSRCPEDSCEPAELVNKAISLLEQTHCRPGDVAFYSKDIQCCQLRMFSLLDDLSNADFDRDFYLVYQPKVRVADKGVAGAEILLRWNSHERGDISPGEFIPVAEQCGMIHRISRWVIQRSFAEIAAMSAADPELLLDKLFAINLSVTDLYDREFVDFIEIMQHRYGIPSSVIEFEITEGVMLDDDPRVAENIDQLLLRKFRIAIDDFGTGYSSLGYLHRLRVHNLKIDRSFVQGMSGQESGDKSALIDAIISMSKSLKIQITAEGVETNQQFSYLVERGCDLVQGFLFSKGLRKDEYVKYCRMAAIPVV